MFKKSHDIPPTVMEHSFAASGGKISQCLWTCCHLSSLSECSSDCLTQATPVWKCSGMHHSSLRLLKAWYCIGFFERILKRIRYLHALLAFKHFASWCGFQFQAAGAPTLATSDDVTDLDLDQTSTISADIPVTVMQELSSWHPQRLE